MEFHSSELVPFQQRNLSFLSDSCHRQLAESQTHRSKPARKLQKPRCAKLESSDIDLKMIFNPS